MQNAMEFGNIGELLRRAACSPEGPQLRQEGNSSGAANAAGLTIGPTLHTYRGNSMPDQSRCCYKSAKNVKPEKMNLRKKKLDDLLQPSTSGPQLRQLRKDYDRQNPGNVCSRHLRLTQKAMNPEEWLVDPATKGAWWRPLPARGVHAQFQGKKRSSDEETQGDSPLHYTEMGARCTCCQESAQSLYSGARHCYDWAGVYLPVCTRRRYGRGLVPTRRKSCRWTAVAARHGSRIANGCSCAGCLRNLF